MLARRGTMWRMQDLLPWMAPWGVWSLYLLMLVAGAVHVWHGWFGHCFHDGPRCPSCGYDRTGIADSPCPECGREIRRPYEPFRSRRRRLWLVALGLLVAAALPSAAVTRRVREYGWDYYRRVGPVYWMFPTETVWSYRNGEYVVACVEDVAEGWANSRFVGDKLLISRGGATLLAAEDSDSICLEEEPAPGTDLNANGLPDVVIRFQSHGSGAYQTYRIFELAPAGLVKLADFDTRGEGPSATFVDEDEDGIYEIIADDWIYDSELGRSYPVPSILLWDGNQFTRRPHDTSSRADGDWQ